MGPSRQRMKTRRQAARRIANARRTSIQDATGPLGFTPSIRQSQSQRATPRPSEGVPEDTNGTPADVQERVSASGQPEGGALGCRIALAGLDAVPISPKRRESVSRVPRLGCPILALLRANPLPAFPLHRVISFGSPVRCRRFHMPDAPSILILAVIGRYEIGLGSAVKRMGNASFIIAPFTQGELRDKIDSLLAESD